MRFVQTTARLVWPAAFWRGMGREIPGNWVRRLLWLCMLLLVAYVWCMTASFAWRVGVNRGPGGQPIILPGLHSRMEFFLPGLYDAGEMAPDGTVRPVWFVSQSYPGLAAGSLMAGVLLMALSRTRAGCGIAAAHITRVTVYGLAPLAMLWFVWGQNMAIAALSSFGVTGIRVMQRSWQVMRIEFWMTAAWLVVYWWYAVRRGLGMKWWVAAAVIAVAGVAAAVVLRSDWRVWA